MAQKKRRFVPRRRWLYPFGVEREYQRFMKRVTQALLEAVKEKTDDLKRLTAFNPLRTDGLSEDILVLIQTIRKLFEAKIHDMNNIAEIRKIAKQLDDFNGNQFRSVMRSALKVDIFQHEPWLNELTDMWITENVRLIKTIPDRFFGEVEGIVGRGLMAGTLTDDLGEQIERVYGVSERRAQLIARDQVGKLNGDLSMYRQTTIGIDSYIWSTSKDQRVRPDHADREGKEFRWNNPPEDGHPGKAIYCRCVALPVIDLDKIRYIGLR